ncbi:hypothetical protein BU15DRAFT_67364 [Melanogaster broomeanus]|nr:hypothetical protein BU15DRAFT_67364 [Melanogaster broomeanus]
MAENPPLPPAVRLLLILMPPGTYGISYDIYTAATENNLPDGWHAARTSTYSELHKSLECGQFVRNQYSDWARDNTDAMTTYYQMLMLRAISPPGKLQSTSPRISVLVVNMPPDLTASHPAALSLAICRQPNPPPTLICPATPGHPEQLETETTGG